MAQLLDPCVWYLNEEVFKIWTSCPVLALGRRSIRKDCKFRGQSYKDFYTLGQIYKRTLKQVNNSIVCHNVRVVYVCFF